MLALLEYFWTSVPSPTPTPAPAPAPSPGGSGGKHLGHGHQKEQYLPFTEDYWKARAERLSVPPSPDEPTPEEKQAQLLADLRQLTVEHEQLLQLQQTHTAALQSLRSAHSVDEMKSISQYINKLAEMGKALTAQYKARIVRAKSLRLELMSKENG